MARGSGPRQRAICAEPLPVRWVVSSGANSRSARKTSRGPSFWETNDSSTTGLRALYEGSFVEHTCCPSSIPKNSPRSDSSRSGGLVLAGTALVYSPRAAAAEADLLTGLKSHKDFLFRTDGRGRSPEHRVRIRSSWSSEPKSRTMQIGRRRSDRNVTHRAESRFPRAHRRNDLHR
jgi:hypothetical protein